MKLNSLEFFLVNNALRAVSQRQIETPRLIGPHGSLAGQRALEIGCGRGVGMEILLSLGAKHVTGFDSVSEVERVANVFGPVWFYEAHKGQDELVDSSTYRRTNMIDTQHITQVKRAELLSSFGAGILGAGIGLWLANALAGYAPLILLLGLLAHSIGMFKKHQLEQDSHVRMWWVETLYWLCWLALAALLLFIAIRTI